MSKPHCTTSGEILVALKNMKFMLNYHDQTTGSMVPDYVFVCFSVSAGKLLAYQDYLLYPTVCKSQPGLTFTKHTTAPSGGVCETIDLNQKTTRSIVTTANVSHLDTVPTNVAQSTTNPSSRCIVTATDTITSVKPMDPGKARPSKTDMPAKAGDRNFVAEFYSNSRLHHISTWGAELKDYVKQLQKKGDGSFPMREKLCKMAANTRAEVGVSTNRDTRTPPGGMSRTKGQRTIMHLDMDSFFVSVGLRNHPHLQGGYLVLTRPGTLVLTDFLHLVRSFTIYLASFQVISISARPSLMLSSGLCWSL